MLELQLYLLPILRCGFRLGFRVQPNVLELQLYLLLVFKRVAATAPYSNPGLNGLSRSTSFDGRHRRRCCPDWRL